MAAILLKHYVLHFSITTLHFIHYVVNYMSTTSTTYALRIDFTYYVCTSRTTCQLRTLRNNYVIDYIQNVHPLHKFLTPRIRYYLHSLGKEKNFSHLIADNQFHLN